MISLRIRTLVARLMPGQELSDPLDPGSLKLPRESRCRSPVTTVPEPAATAHSRIRLSVSSRGTASSASAGVSALSPGSSIERFGRGDVVRESQELPAQISDVFFRNVELVLQDTRSLIEDGVGHSQLNLASPCEFEEFERLAAAQEGRDEDVRVCRDPCH
jgi:hypothetical protein